MNLVKGTLDAGQLALDDGRALPLLAAPKALHGHAVIAGIRPENLDVVESGGLKAEVTAVEPTGSETLLTALASGQSFTSLIHRRLVIEPGTSVQLAAKGDAIHFFDPESQVRL